MTTVEKPWGWYKVLDEGANFVIKTIYIKPNSKFSLQKHMQREEYWTVISGSGLITLGESQVEVKEGDHFHIPVEMIHRLEGGPSGILFAEIQKGICSEEDIIRLQDDYGRHTI